MTVIPRTLLQNMNIKPETIFPVSTRLNGASNAPIMVDGGILLTITAVNKDTNRSRTTHQLCYVSRHVTTPFLSFDACIDLGVLSGKFPEIGSQDERSDNSVHTDDIRSDDSAHPVDYTAPKINAMSNGDKCINTGIGSQSACSCPRREPPPQAPPVLPCPPTPENVPLLKRYILERYKASAFNCCEHQPLNLMEDSPPLRVFVDEDATPVAIHTPSQVPLHWKSAVKEGLDRDVRLGVLEKVPVNDPVTWCSRMVITPKPDGSPR